MMNDITLPCIGVHHSLPGGEEGKPPGLVQVKLPARHWLSGPIPGYLRACRSPKSTHRVTPCPAPSSCTLFCRPRASDVCPEQYSSCHNLQPMEGSPMSRGRPQPWPVVGSGATLSTWNLPSQLTTLLSTSLISKKQQWGQL